MAYEDVLARRVRLLFVDAREAAGAAPLVVETLAAELGYGAHWVADQVAQFRRLAARYYLDD